MFHLVIQGGVLVRAYHATGGCDIPRDRRSRHPCVFSHSNPAALVPLISRAT